MDKECKISLPFYKIAYAVFFVVVLSLIRGVTFTYEIGIAMEAPMAMLASVFCADTYAQEVVSGRSQLQRLYPMQRRVRSLMRRMVIQELFLFLLAAAGWGSFRLIQKPMILYAAQAGNEAAQYFLYLAAMLVTLCLWGILSNLLSVLLRNMWFGIGGCLALWLVTNSTHGERLFGKWNLFSYSFRNAEDSSDLSWLCGKLVCVCLCIAMTAALPKIIRERG